MAQKSVVRVVVGSKNKVKIEAVRQAFDSTFPNAPLEFTGTLRNFTLMIWSTLRDLLPGLPLVFRNYCFSCPCAITTNISVIRSRCWRDTHA